MNIKCIYTKINGPNDWAELNLVKDFVKEFINTHSATFWDLCHFPDAFFFYCNQRKFQSFSPLLFDISCKIWPNWIVIISSATFWDLCNFSDDIDCSTKRSVSIFLRYLLIYPLKFDQINCSIFLRYFLIFPPLLWCYCLDMNLTKQIEVFCSATFGNLCHFPDAFVWVQPNKVSFFSATFLYIL